MEDRSRHVARRRDVSGRSWFSGRGALIAALTLWVTPAAASQSLQEAKQDALVGDHAGVVQLLGGGVKRSPAEAALYARSLCALGQVKEARAALKNCVKRWPCAAAMGRLERRYGDRRAAVKWFSRAVKLAPKRATLQLAMGEALYAIGQAYRAKKLLDPLADRYEASRGLPTAELVAIAESLALNGYFKDANQVFADAAQGVAGRADRKLIERAWGALFLSKYNFKDADMAFAKVLKIDPSDVIAVAGMVRIDLDSDRNPRKAKKRLTAALKRRPKEPLWLALRAEVALHDEDLTAARQWVGKALNNSPSHQHALAVRYATCALADDRRCMKRTLKLVAKAHPSDPAPHLVAARYLEAAHRYGRVIQELKLALKRNLESPRAHAALGMSYARMADDTRAFKHLETAFRLDPYNVRTANVLNVLYDGALKHMPVLKGERVDLRVHKRHRLAMERTVLPFLQESYDVLARKYKMKPKPPLRVEVFPSTEQFSVRTVGLPALGAHAVCFGHLITSRSPTEKPFNWKMVLHHEMAHVFHIQATDGRVPRWLTEGLAMMESVWLNPRYHMNAERRLYQRMSAGKLAKVRHFNLAFSQARSMAEIGDAYYQAMRLTEFLDERYGFAKLRALVAAHKGGETTAKLVKQVYKLTPEQLDEAFAQWLKEHLKRFDGDFNPSRARIKQLWTNSTPSLKRAWEAVKKKDSEALMSHLKAAVEKKDASAEALCAARWMWMARAKSARRWKEAKAQAEALVATKGCDGVKQRLLLARLLRKTDKKQALKHVHRALEINPRDRSVMELALRWTPKDDPARLPLVRRLLAAAPNAVSPALMLARSAWKTLFPKGLTSEAAVMKPSALRRRAIQDLRLAATQLEETTPHTSAQALWEGRLLAAQGRWRAAALVYPLAARRGSDPAQRQRAWCEMVAVAKRAGDERQLRLAKRRCGAKPINKTKTPPSRSPQTR